MLKFATTIGFVLSASVAFAESYNVTATVKRVEVYQETVTQNVPTTQCSVVSVPIYGQNKSNSGDVLGGMIIGGLVGKGATGNDNGAAIGAVLGGMIAADNTGKRIIGYQNVDDCQTVWRQEQVDIGTQYIVSYDWNGLAGKVNTSRRYFVGDMINITVNLD